MQDQGLIESINPWLDTLCQSIALLTERLAWMILES